MDNYGNYDNNNLKDLYMIKAKYEVLVAALENAAAWCNYGCGISYNSDIIDAVLAAVEPEEHMNLKHEVTRAAEDAEDKKMREALS